jgi:flavin-binding protein dodecin
MSVVKVIEVISEGKNVEDALNTAVKEAAKTVENINQINVDHILGIVENNQITKTRIHAKISFVVER